MTRAECEKQLMEHLESMVAILHQYSPNSEYLQAGFVKDENGVFFTIHNEGFNPDATDSNAPVYCHKLGNSELVSIDV